MIVSRNDINNICVCVCFYNTNPIFLEECFNSIHIAKTYFEKIYNNIPVYVHVMNDGTTDINTINMFEDICKKYTYIEYWSHESNTTLATAINDLHKYTPNDSLVIYIDSDDIMVHNRIVIQYEIMTKYKKWKNISLCASLTTTPVHQTSNNYMMLKYYNYDILDDLESLTRNIIIHSTIAYKINHLRLLYVKYDDQFKCTQDYDFYLNLLHHHGAILLTPDALTWHREYDDINKPDSNRHYTEEFLKIQKKYDNYTLWDNCYF